MLLPSSKNSRVHLRINLTGEKMKLDLGEWIEQVNTSAKFKHFCTEHGIGRQLTTILAPEQNGIYEHNNQIVLDRARNMAQ